MVAVKQRTYLICGAISAAAILFAAPAAAAGPMFQGGMWEITSTVSGTGMAQEMQSTKNQCLDQKGIERAFAQRPSDSFIKGSKAAGLDCPIFTVHPKPNGEMWRLVCSNANSGTEQTSDLTYTATAFSQTFSNTTSAAGTVNTIVTRTNGRFVGACN